MKTWLNTYFDFTRREFNGLLVLIVLIVLATVFPYVYSLIKSETEPITEVEKQAVLKLLSVDEPRANYVIHEPFVKKSVDANKRNLRLFVFDPNTIGLEDWEKLGLSVKQALAVLKYRAKGGQFRKTADLQKMYTISDRMYRKLAPYIRIARRNKEKQNDKSKLHGNAVQQKLRIIEINGADTAKLDEIKGIGKVFADRILKYRTRIGGFYKKEQLMEVFGLDSVKYNEIKDQVTIDISKLKKININTAGFNDFKNHPYIRYKQVNALIQYRKQHGNYSNIADLNKVAIITSETITRLAPYLEF